MENDAEEGTKGAAIWHTAWPMRPVVSPASIGVEFVSGHAARAATSSLPVAHHWLARGARGHMGVVIGFLIAPAAR